MGVRGYRTKRSTGGEGSEGQYAPACTLSGNASAQAMPPPKVPSTLLSAAPTHLGFLPPPGSLLGCPPAQPASTLSSFGLPQAPTTVNSLAAGCSQALRKSQMTQGGDWGPPAHFQFSRVPPCATLIPRHLPALYLFLPPKRHPLFP